MKRTEGNFILYLRAYRLFSVYNTLNGAKTKLKNVNLAWIDY